MVVVCAFGAWHVCVRVAFVVDFGAGRCSASAVGLVVKYLVAIEMPRVRFPDGALSYAHTSPTAPFLRGRYPASTPRQRVLSSAPSRAGLPATPPLADAVRLKNHILRSVELAARTEDQVTQEKLLHINLE